MVSFRFLPQLDQELQPPSPTAGSQFGPHGGGLTVLANYSAALVVPHTDVPTERLKSVPNPWARLLLFEQALFSTKHPAHKRILQEWRGVLGAIGLARFLDLDLKVEAVDLAEGGQAIQHLRAMAPRDQGAEVWDHIALLRIDGALVGGTSPRTLFFTGIRPNQTGRVPFQKDGRLVDPVEHYRRLGDGLVMTLLTEWIGHLVSRLQDAHQSLDLMLGSTDTGPSSQPLSRSAWLFDQLERWRLESESAVRAIGRSEGPVVSRYIGTPLNAAFPADEVVARVMICIEQVEPAPVVWRNDLSVDGTDAVVEPGESGRLTREGQLFSGDLTLPRGKTRRVQNGRFLLATGSRDSESTWPDFGEFFEKKLIPVVDVNPSAAHAMDVGGHKYLVPLSAEILKWVGPEQLIRWLSSVGDPAGQITVRLTVPLRSGLAVVYEREYGSVDILREEQVAIPLITEWPDFEREDWHHHYYVVRQTSRTGTPFWFEPFALGPAEMVSEEAAGLRWGRCERAPKAWVGRHGTHSGILLSVPRTQVRRTVTEWDIAVDFGSTHSRAFKVARNIAGEQSIEEVVLQSRVRAVLGVENQLSFFFMGGQPADSSLSAEPQSLIWLPLGQVRRTQSNSSWMPSDGFIYWGRVGGVPSADHLRGDLKWHRDDADERAAFHSYIANLYVAIAGEAAAHGASIGSITTAYPSVLPKQLRHRHRQEWLEVGRRFGVRVRDPQSEAGAVAAYFIGRQGATAQGLVAIDVGGSTSDVAVWIGTERKYSDSVRLAGDILSRLISRSRPARDALVEAVRRPPFNLPGIQWDPAESGRNGLVFNSLLRELSRNPAYQSQRDVLAQNLYQGPKSPGEYLISHLAYLFAVTSFFAGMAVRKAELQRDRYEMRYAGKGAEFLHWLEALSTGASRILPAVFFRAGADAPDAEVDVSPPGITAKQEVGRGLLTDVPQNYSEPDERVTIVGEDGFDLLGRALAWQDELVFDVLTRMRPPAQPRSLESLTCLRKFVDAFDDDPAAKKAARTLRLRERFDTGLRDRIHDRLFGPTSAWQAVQDPQRDQSDTRLLEPFFIVEAKMLLEHATENYSLFEM